MVKTIQQMIRVAWKQLLVSSFLIICLLVLLNILAVGARNTKQLSKQVQQQLGVFIYLRDDSGEKAVKMIAELKQVGLETTFFSKEDAFRILQKKLPNILTNLEKYGIENPLPPTVYIVYTNQEEYESMKSIIVRYSDIINTSSNLGLQNSFQEQTRRASKLVSLMNIIFSVFVFLVCGVIVMICMVVLYITTTLFYRFEQQVEITSLLGGSRFTILSPFLGISVGIHLLSWAMSSGLLAYLAQTINKYFLSVMDRSFIESYLPSGSIVLWMLVQLLIIVCISAILVHFQISAFVKKQHYGSSA